MNMEVPKELRGALAVRLVSGMIGKNGNIIAIGYLPITLVTIFTRTAPFWSIILCYFIFKETIEIK